MQEKREKTVHVLDLACGQALGRIPLIFRHEDKRIHYVGVDHSKRYLLDYDTWINNFPDLEREGVASHAPGFMAVLKPMGADEFRKKLAEGKKRLTEEFHLAQLEFGDPELLCTQLYGIAGDQKFDEIHLHMPALRGNYLPDPESLKVVAGFLKPGGMLYHMFENKSPFLPLALVDSWRGQFKGTPLKKLRTARVFATNKAAIKKAAGEAGLELSKYGMKYDYEPHFMTGIARLKARKSEKADATFNALAELYSFYGHSANNFMILRKPKNAK